MMRSLICSCCLGVAVLLCSSCSLQPVSESSSRAEQDAVEASRYAALARHQQPEPPREAVIFGDKPWVSTRPVMAKRGLPAALDCGAPIGRPGRLASVTWRSSSPMSAGVRYGWRLTRSIRR